MTGSAMSQESQPEVFLRSLALVGIAELFDKTWFMGLLLALRYRASTVFLGSFTALFLHCFLAAGFGLAFARFLDSRTLNFLAAALFGVFSVLYAKDWCMADPDSDAIAAGRAEAAEDCEIDGDSGSDGDEEEEDEEEQKMGKAQLISSTGGSGGSAESAGKQDRRSDDDSVFREGIVFTKSFMGVFIAEWGDRTQIAMIGQHASQPLVPVFLGSVLAFFLLTLSAVGLASVTSNMRLSEKLVHGVSAVFFAVFALLALKDAVAAPAGGAQAESQRSSVE